MKNVRSSFCLGAAGIVFLLASNILRGEGIVQGTAAYSSMYLGFLGKFSVQIAIATTASLLWSQPTSPLKRLIVLVLLTIAGIGVSLTSWSSTSLINAIRSNPISLVSPIATAVVPVIVLVGIAAIVTSIRAGNRRQFTIAQTLSLVTIACVCCLGLRSHGTFALVAFTAMALLGVTGFVIAKMVKPGPVAVHVLALAGVLISMATLFLANQQCWFDWFGFTPKLGMYCDSGIVPVAVAVTFAAGLAVAFRPRINSIDDAEPNHAREGRELKPSVEVGRPR